MKITEDDILNFERKLTEEEKSEHTVEKYVRDIITLKEYCNGETDRDEFLEYKDIIK